MDRLKVEVLISMMYFIRSNITDGVQYQVCFEVMNDLRIHLWDDLWDQTGNNLGVEVRNKIKKKIINSYKILKDY